MVAQQQVAPRASLEVPRSEGVTPGTLSPNPSRRGSISLASGAVSVPTATAVSSANKEEALRRESEKAEARITCDYLNSSCLSYANRANYLLWRHRGLKRSIVDLTTSTTKTSRRLDDAYRVLYDTLPYLQQTIVNLKELAVASKIMNEGFVAESRSMISEAQAQLDAFGSFDEQQARVQALQDRVHSGKEKIASLSARVDVVRQRVEQWERADREWQERTRRRLKIVWGIVLAVGLVLVVLYVGARTYAPEMAMEMETVEGATRELQDEAMLVKMKLDGGLDSPATSSSSKAEDGAVPALNFSTGRDGRAAAGDEALRALDEL